MHAWLPLLSVPAALIVMMGILVLSQLVEQHVLSPRAMIIGAARSRSTSPDYAEGFVAGQLERLLRDAQRREASVRD
jgi:hypothetical protein